MDERDLERVERALIEAGAPAEPPAHLATLARDAALGPPEVVRIDSRRSGGLRRWQRPLLAVAVIAASTIAALVIGVGGNSQPVAVTLPLNGLAGATGSVDFGEADGAVRRVVLHVSGLPPAPEGSYYEMWMRDRTEQIPVASFDTEADGSVTATASVPADMGWDRCWVTLEPASIDAGKHVVLSNA